MALSNKLLDNTLPCLEMAGDDKRPIDLYTAALTAYSLTLAGRHERARRYVDELMNRSQNTNSFLWWEKPGTADVFSNARKKRRVLLVFFFLPFNQVVDRP